MENTLSAEQVRKLAEWLGYEYEESTGRVKRPEEGIFWGHELDKPDGMNELMKRLIEKRVGIRFAVTKDCFVFCELSWDLYDGESACASEEAKTFPLALAFHPRLSGTTGDFN